MRALLIDDQHVVRESLEMLLQVALPELCVDHADGADAAVALAATTNYGYIVLDWWLGEGEGAECLQRLRAIGCTAPVLVVSGDDSAELKQRVLALGAAGCVAKSGGTGALLQAIRRALAAPSGTAEGPP